MKKDIESIREYFKGDTFALYNGIKIVSADDQEAIVECEINKNHFNAKGSVQGGLIFTLADFAFAIVTNLNEYTTVAQNVTITFLRPVFEGILTAKATVINQSKKMALVEIEVKNFQDKLVAKMHANGYKIV